MDCSASFVIGQSNYFGFGLTTLNWKLLYGKKRGAKNNQTLHNPFVTAPISIEIILSSLKGPSQPHLCFCLHVRLWLFFYYYSEHVAMNGNHFEIT